MRDIFNREIDYMRVSVTDRCNLRCRYCMPNGIKTVPMEEILTLEEIIEICKVGATLGIKKLKITGGEPLVRKGCPELIGKLKQISGIEQVTMTTNGILLGKLKDELCENHVDAINISLDTLNPEKFKEITGFDGLKDVISGLESILDAKIPVKINSVLQKGMNEDEWESIIELAREYPVDVRFIEMMPIGYGKQYETIYNEEVLHKISKKYPSIQADEFCHGNGPAIYYKIPEFNGSIGFISAMHGKFCGSCNRIRLTSIGRLKPCLCYNDSVDIRSAIRGEGNLEEVFMSAIQLKPEKHNFEQLNLVTESKDMVQIGG